MPIYNPSLQELSTSEIQRYSGMKDSQHFPVAAVEAAAIEALLLSRPQSSWELYSYDASTGIIDSPTPITLTAPSIRSHLVNSQKVIVLSATIGESLEQSSADYFSQGSYSHALLLDAAGSTAVEAVVDQLESFLFNQFSVQGFSFTQRFSPGYGDWSIEIQPQMLLLTHAEKINIMSTCSCMLLPRKSVTAIIGLQAGQARQNVDTHCQIGCANCSLTNCASRKKSKG